MKIDGDTARVSSRAIFLDESGDEDPEGLRFSLRKIDGAWEIVERG